MMARVERQACGSVRSKGEKQIDACLETVQSPAMCGLMVPGIEG
jgi:hypothetical protein